MSRPEIRKIVIIGAGRMAVNLSMAIYLQGYEIIEVCNRTESKGLFVAKQVNARYVPEPEMLASDADLYILAVSDTAIPLMLDRIRTSNHLIVHTSGSVDMDVLQCVSTNYGVFYSPQTFTTQTLVNFSTVPICIEASSDENQSLLKSFAGSLSQKVYSIDSDQRKVVHLAAVFAGNFTNFLYSVSQVLLQEKEMNLEILAPIINQTAFNISSNDVFKMQTGPAVREDWGTIQNQLKLLSSHPDFAEIYDLITKKIIQRKKYHDQL